MRSLKEQTQAVVDLGVVLMIGITFAGLTVVAYIIFKIKDQLAMPSTFIVQGGTRNLAERMLYNSTKNVTNGFDNAISLILVAITIFILAIAISALLMLRGRQD